MTLQYGDRVQEIFTTTGTGTISLGGAVTGYQPFSGVMSDGNTCYYCATDGTNWEVGLGTFALAGDTLARTSILASSNGGAAVNWSAGTKNIWLNFPAAAIPGPAPIASTSVPGLVMPDGTILTINPSTGALTAAQASASQFGVCKVDNSTITASGGVLTATASPAVVSAGAVGTFATAIDISANGIGQLFTVGTNYAGSTIHASINFSYNTGTWQCMSYSSGQQNYIALGFQVIVDTYQFQRQA